MRISGGTARGIRLKVAPGTRPTSEVVRAAVFSSLARHVDDASVLDLYCGSGAYGLEALSRGAASAVFVDRDSRAMQATRANAQAAGSAGDARFRRRDALIYARRDAAREGPFDLVFVDPPYGDAGAPGTALRSLAEAVCDGGLVVLEARKDAEPPEAGPDWILDADRRYGDTRVLVYRRLALRDRREERT